MANEKYEEYNEDKEYEVGDRIKSRLCPPFCDNNNCYEERVEIELDGEKIEIWEGHCKALEKVEKKAMDKIS